MRDMYASLFFFLMFARVEAILLEGFNQLERTVGFWGELRNYSLPENGSKECGTIFLGMYRQ